MGKNQINQASTEGAIVVSTADSAVHVLSAMRAAVAPLLKTAVSTPAPAKAEETLGELRLVPLSDITVGERFRVDLGDLSDFAESIREVGLLNPILLNPTLHLVGGMRRLEAYRLLGRTEIPARVLDIEDESLAAMEEDRSRKPLSATEKYAATEYLREKIARDPNWRQNAMGGRLEKAILRSRLEDFLGKHVGISRPTLAKIRAMVEAGKKDPARYATIVEDLDRDGKVDGHYKRYLAERAKDEGTPRFRAILLAPTWQELDAKSLRKVIGAMELAKYAEDECLLLVPTSVSALTRASGLLSTAKFTWLTAVEGSATDSEHLWLAAARGKTFPQDLELSLLWESCKRGYIDTIETANDLTDGSALPIDLAQLATAA
jgi:ParB-like chromosome segregation protein Spo0J